MAREFEFEFGANRVSPANRPSSRPDKDQSRVRTVLTFMRTAHRWRRRLLPAVRNCAKSSPVQQLW
jgi:hypothetical protein